MTANLFQRIFLILFKKNFIWFSWIFLSVYLHFIYKTLEEFRVWMSEKGTNSYNEKVLASLASPPAPPPGGAGPWTRSLPPYTPSFPLYTQPSRIGGIGFSSQCVHSLCCHDLNRRRAMVLGG